MASWYGAALHAAGVPGSVCVYGGIVAAGGSFVPDCDHHNAKITHTLGWIGALLSFAARLFGGHRGWTHTLFGASVMGALFGIGCGMYPEPITATWWWVAGLGMALGCLAHILGDMCTVQGCDLFWVPGSRFRRWCIIANPISTESDDERDWYLMYFRPLAYGSVIGSVVVSAAL